jgi:hypothetical protein
MSNNKNFENNNTCNVRTHVPVPKMRYPVLEPRSDSDSDSDSDSEAVTLSPVTISTCRLASRWFFALVFASYTSFFSYIYTAVLTGRLGL